MTSSDSAASPIVIRCPACGASEPADPALLAGSPMIVCCNCGETWPVAARPARAARQIALAPDERRGTALVEARRQPLVTFSDGIDKAWVARMEADRLPETRKRSALPLTLAATASALFLTLALGARQAAVAALPDLGGLYAAIGLPVNLTGLRLEEISAERQPGEAGGLVVRGIIRNVSGRNATIPPFVVRLGVAGGATLATHGADPPGTSVFAGDSVPFSFALESAPQQATEVLVRFRRPAERPVSK